MVLLGVKFYCKESQYIMIPLPDGTSKEYCQYTEGEQIMEINGFEVYIPFYFFIFLFLCILFHFLKIGTTLLPITQGILEMA